MLYKKENDKLLCFLKSKGFEEAKYPNDQTWIAKKIMNEWGLTVSFSYDRRLETVTMNAYFVPYGYPHALSLMRKFSFHDFSYMSDDEDVAKRIFIQSHKEISSVMSTITLKFMALKGYSLADEGEIQDMSYYEL